MREAEEFFSEGQKGSSSMPHKRNPVLTENLTGLARVVRSAVIPALENVTLWHERDISHSSAERYIAPDATVTLDFALNRLASVVEQLVVYGERMKANLDSLGGLVFSQRVLLALTQKGMSREDSYAAVQRNAMEAWRGNASFLALCRADKEIRAVPGGRRARGAVRHGLPHQARRHDLQARVRLAAGARPSRAASSSMTRESTRRSSAQRDPQPMSASGVARSRLHPHAFALARSYFSISLITACADSAPAVSCLALALS